MLMGRLISSATLATAIVVGAAFTALPANASIIDWTLVGVTFVDGGTAGGTFSTDSTTGHVTAFDIITTAGTTLPGQVYDSTTSFLLANNFNSPNSFITYLNDLSAAVYLNLEFVNPLTSSGVDSLVTGYAYDNSTGYTFGSWECRGCTNLRTVTAGEAVSATPLPSTWTMLIVGFLGLGFFAYRGTRNRSAAIAAA